VSGARLFCGVDPGFTGAVAWIDEESKYELVQDMPLVEYTVGKKKHRMVDLPILAGRMDIDHCAISIEFVNAFGMGLTSAFNFGGAFHACIGAARLSGNRWQLITPVKWKRAVGLPKGADKAASLALARQLWPDAPLDRKKDIGRAEALLIAEAHRRAALGVSA